MEESNQRAIGRILKVSPQTVANWISNYTSKLPPVQMPKKPHTAELDEMYTFKAEKIYFQLWSTELTIVF